MSSPFNDKKCIIFGANGYIGRHLVYALREEQCIVQAFDIQNKPFVLDVDYRTADVTAIHDLRDIDWDVDFVFMFAGLTGTHNGFENYQLFVKVNEIGLLNVLDCIRKSNYNSRLIFPSTRLVYKGSNTPLKEDAAKEPKTIYAINKLACENILEAYKNTFGVNYTNYRICVPYGNSYGNDYSYGTVGNFINQAKNNGLIRLYGDGLLRRTFTHVEDVCQQIIVSCIHHESQNKTFNIFGEDSCLKDIAALIADKYNAKLDFMTWPENDLRIESGHTIFDASLIKEIFNIGLKYKIHDWINNLG